MLRAREPKAQMGLTKVWVFGSGTRKNQKYEVWVQVGSGWTFPFGFFQVRKPEKSWKFGSGFKNSGFLDTLLHNTVIPIQSCQAWITLHNHAKHSTTMQNPVNPGEPCQPCTTLSTLHNPVNPAQPCITLHNMVSSRGPKPEGLWVGLPFLKFGFFQVGYPKVCRTLGFFGSIPEKVDETWT